MVKAGTAYHCYCSKEELDAMRADQQSRKEKPRYDGRCRHGKGPGAASGRAPVVRFANPEEGATVVEDVVHGPVTFQNKELDDLIIARSDGTPTYNFCVVVDDADMGVTHVIRGDDHLNNTPRQMNMLLALGKQPPVYAHVPMILGPDGAKLSKRHGAVSVLEYQDQGYLPEALLNYLVRLGWSHGDQEYFTRDGDDRGLRRARHQQVGLGAQSGEAAVAQPAAPGARRSRRTWCRTCAGTWRGSASTRRTMRCSRASSLAQRERAKTLKEMAENSRFFFGDEVTLDPKAAEKHLTAEAKALAGRTAHALRGARGLGRARGARGARRPGDRRSRWASARWRSRCAWPSRAARCRRPSMPRWRCSARRARWRACDRALTR